MLANYRFQLALALLAAVPACAPESPVSQPPIAVKPAEESPMLAPIALGSRRYPHPDGTLPSQQLHFRLSNGSPPPSDADLNKRAVTAPLTADETAKLLARLPKLEQQAGDAQPFAMRDKSLPAPRPGETVAVPFPAPDAPDAPTPTVTAGPLQLLRYGPQGDVALAPRISLTFSQPMVPVTDQTTLSKLPVPVQVTPALAGEWRWLGTQTLIFQPKERLPMATSYVVTVPAGTKSQTGGALDKEFKFAFMTPTVQMAEVQPSGGGLPLKPVIFAVFNQAIAPKDVLAHTVVTAAGAPVAVDLLDAKALAAVPGWAWRVDALERNGQGNRWVALQPKADLPKNTAILVKWGPNLPSAEGPRTSPSVTTQSFSTYGPLTLVETQCGWDNQCPPLQPWTLSFSNPLDAKLFDAKWVTVEPAVPNLRVEVSGNTLTLSGLTKGNVKYKVTVAHHLTDAYAQTLGKDVTAAFKTTRAAEAFQMTGGMLTVLDPYAKAPQLSAWTVNHRLVRVRMWRVEPGQWWAWLKAQKDVSDRETQPNPPGTLAVDKLVNVKGEADEITETLIDLREGLKGHFGHLIVHVEPTKQPKERWRQQHFWTWVQVTHLGLTATLDRQDLQAWATELGTGKPAAGAQLKLFEAKGKENLSAVADAQGNATLKLPEGGEGPRVLVVQKDADTAMLPEREDYWSDYSNWRKTNDGQRGVWHVVDDRGLYKPGETARIKGWMRTVGGGPKGDLQAWNVPPTLNWRLRDARGNVVGKGKAPVTPGSSFDFAVELPKNIHLGHAQVILSWQDDHWDFTHNLRIEEFRRPEFETTTQADPGPYIIGDHALATTLARYYAGGGLPGAEVHWQVNAQQGHFEPAGWQDWTFGKTTPWWMRGWGSDGDSGDQSQTFESRLSGAGQHILRADFDSSDVVQPWAVTAHATVYDVNRQAWTSTAHILVHPAALYAGLKVDRAFVQAGETVDVGVVAADLQGKAKAGVQVKVAFFRNEEVQVKGEYVTQRADEQICNWTSGEKAGSCAFVPKSGGLWQIVASLQDDKGRKNETTSTLYVSGKGAVQDRDLPEDQVRLVPDKQQYVPGDTAKVLVIAPWPNAEGELTVAREGRLSRQHFSIAGLSHTLNIALEDANTPNVVAHVVLLGQAPRDGADGRPDPKLPPRPAYASGELSLAIPPLHRTLTAKVTPRDADAAPGQETAVEVQVLDAQGKPVADSEVTLAMADEAVLALTGYRIPSPLNAFYPTRGSGLVLHELRRWLLLAAMAADLIRDEIEGSRPVVGHGSGGMGFSRAGRAAKGGSSKMYAEAADGDVMAKPMAAPPPPGAAREEKKSKERETTRDPKKTPATGADAPEPEPAIALRKDFNPLAVWAPMVKTDAQGKVTVKVKLPDSLTRYRVMVVAAGGEKFFGSGEATVVARLPLMVRPSAPRFANFGDHFELPVVLQNQTGKPLEVQLAARSTVLQVPKTGVKFTVPPNDRVEVRLPTDAPQAGTGRVQFAVSTAGFADAAEIALPVWTPATTEAFATYGVLDAGVRAQPIRSPANVVKQYGGLQITTSSTALQGLTDAVLYLIRYPFECSEQRASRMLSIAALRDVLQAFGSKDMPSDPELAASMEADIRALGRLQNYDGGFGFWKQGEQSWPVTSLHVTHALVRAQGKGYAVPKNLLDRALGYVRNIERYLPHWYGEESKRVLRAEALYVRLQAGDRDVKKAQALAAEVKDVSLLPLEAIGWIWPVLSGDKGSEAVLKAIRAHVNNRIEEQAGAAHFTVRYSEGAHLLLASDRRADAILLDALITDNPKSDVIPKIVTGLLAHRKQGKWGSTQENSWILLSLDRYFRTYENVTPDFVAKLWLGEQYAGAQEFKGRSTDRKQLLVPMAMLQEGPRDRNLLIQKDGAGRLYYRVGMDYAPADLKLPPMDRGFFVQRTYEAVDKPTDVQRDADGTWRVKAGARVRVKVEMVAQARRYHVALVDPLPAGFEIINGSLMGAEPPPPHEPKPSGSSHWWWGRWYEHDNLRDERAEAFTSLLWEGDWEYTYLCRATTPGTFAVPPAKAEEMYSPEVFGRSGSERLVVVD